MSKNYYEVLGVPKTATEDELKKAYRTLSKKYHPDLQQGKTDAEKKAAEEKFKDINEAYSVLGDKEKRSKYDTFGTADAKGGMGFESGGFGFNPMEFFRRHFSSFTDGFDFGGDTGDGYASGESDGSAQKNGRNVEIGLEVSFEEAIYGSTREFDIKFEDRCSHCGGTGSDDKNMKSCPDCNGTGMRTVVHNHVRFFSSTCPICRGRGVVPSTPCHVCHGSGVETVNHHINIRIPRGVATNERLRVPGEGCRGVDGGTNGDLFITIQAMSHPLFERNGNNLSTVVYMPAIAVGIQDEIDVMTPWGEKRIKIPEKMEPNGTFVAKMSGYGVKSRKHGVETVGDLYITIVPDSLVNLTDKQKKLAKKLCESVTTDNMSPSARRNHDLMDQFFRIAENHKTDKP